MNLTNNPKMYTEAHAEQNNFFLASRREGSSRISHIASARVHREKPLTEKRVHPRHRRRRGCGGILEKRPEGLLLSLLAGDALALRGSGLLDDDDEIVPAVQYHRLLFESRVASCRETLAGM